MFQREAIITSPYKYNIEERRAMERMYYRSRPIYERPRLEPDEQLPYPIIIQVESLNDSYNREMKRKQQSMASRSMIYFPRNSQSPNKCSCSECEDRVVVDRQPFIDRRRSSSEDSAAQHTGQIIESRSTRVPSPSTSWKSSVSSPKSETTISTKETIDREVSSPEAQPRECNGGESPKEKPRNNGSSKMYTCHVCDRGFTWFGNFQKHVLTHGDQSQEHPYFVGKDIPEEKIIIREDNSTFRCGLCSKTFTRMSGLRTHIRMHNGQRPFKCMHCELAFTTNRALKMHTRIHSGERPYKCSQCTKTFTRKDELQAHIYLHKGEKPYKCEKCPAAFVRHGHLQRHMLTHASEKPYKCKDCPKSFTQYRNLQTHMYKHTGERPYKCKYCGKGFTQHGTVQAHERTHTGNKPYACKQCDKRFITSSHLRWHVKKHHQQNRHAIDLESEMNIEQDADIESMHGRFIGIKK